MTERKQELDWDRVRLFVRCMQDARSGLSLPPASGDVGEQLCDFRARFNLGRQDQFETR